MLKYAIFEPSQTMKEIITAIYQNGKFKDNKILKPHLTDRIGIRMTLNPRVSRAPPPLLAAVLGPEIDRRMGGGAGPERKY